jgi:hypothetical protein
VLATVNMRTVDRPYRLDHDRRLVGEIHGGI